MAGTPRRAYKTEQELDGADWIEASIASAMLKMSEDYQPLSDMRASSQYRMLAAQNLLRKFYIETTTADRATRIVGEGGLAYA